ncbi:acetyl-CoA carboxylase biotin carboxyl carrier protein subunit [Flavivirga algicola]|uniref:Acetyl-CoA carboxylase biotin carboxyl carrier protein subunit n=1 Tax=Flavivirga algicola TaxID=2729136 RepID=A0ABX1RSZ4_9FLAO|nr:acetyl-CoA carboxylase biotin carboxyl carrier protein subunit [Flavivirga algicola]NMH86105.1 acetyl-CoA carboxylase biotin carboxyl carrier protein subunit [Flavivirga algicola]
MSKTFKTSVNNTFDFEIKDGDISNLDTLQISESRFHILEQNKSYDAEITIADFYKKSYEVNINNNIYTVNISNQLDDLIKEMGFAIGSAKHIDSVKAPMPGLILEINVKVNQEVQEDEPLLILEAMKMENIITAPTSGVIKSISVSNGDTVEKNQPLIEFDA